MNEQANRIPTTKRLADALREAGASEEMIKKAEQGYYDDFKSPLAQNIVQLVTDAHAAGLDEIARRAMDDEFISTDWEAEEWLNNSPEGRAIRREFFGAPPTAHAPARFPGKKNHRK